MQTLPDIFGDVIHSYSRAEALEDGVLVAVDEAVAREAGFKIPVALTRAAFEDCVAWPAEHELYKPDQDEAGRLWDVLFLAVLAALRGSGRRVPFTVNRVPAPPAPGIAATPVRLVAEAGPGDHGEPVVTIMLEGED